MHYERLAEAIFFPRKDLPEDLKDVPTREKVMEQIRSDTYTYSQFVKMPLEAQQRLLDPSFSVQTVHQRPFLTDAPQKNV